MCIETIAIVDRYQDKGHYYVVDDKGIHYEASPGAWCNQECMITKEVCNECPMADYTLKTVE